LSGSENQLRLRGEGLYREYKTVYEAQSDHV
jgi:hypothetical protein